MTITDMMLLFDLSASIEENAKEGEYEKVCKDLHTFVSLLIQRREVASQVWKERISNLLITGTVPAMKIIEFYLSSEREVPSEISEFVEDEIESMQAYLVQLMNPAGYLSYKIMPN